MRIISGNLRGLKLNSPAGNETRPTLDRVKEAIFSMLMPYLADSVVLDLFAGSGALGIEALSRGACKAFFIDSSPEAISCVNSNLKAGRLESLSVVHKGDASAFLKNCSEKFDIIFLDPPYFAGIYEEILQLIDKYDLLTEDGMIIAEWDYENGFPDVCSSLEIFREKKYGRVGVTVLKRSFTE